MGNKGVICNGDIQKAEVKVKLVTDTYMLQYHQDKFKRHLTLHAFSVLETKSHAKVYLAI
jgi:hypothetical protein